MKTSFSNFYSVVINWFLLYYVTQDLEHFTWMVSNAFMSYDDERKFYKLMEYFLLTPPFREDSRGL